MALTLDGTTGISATGNIYGNNVIATGSLTAGTFSPTSVSASGNITGGNILGGANVNATTHTGTTVSVTANITGGNLLTAGLISATGAITSSGSGTFVGVAAGGGNVSGANFTTPGLITATGNITGGNIRTAGLISATGAITGAALTGTSLTVSTGNITGGNLLLSGAIIDSAQLDIQTSAANANIAFAPNGTGMVTVSTQVSVVGNILTGGFISATGNLRGGNLLTAGSISAGGNITISGFISATGAVTGAALTGSSLTVSTGNITTGNIVNGNGNGVGNIGSATTYFNTVFANATSAQYADLAEMYLADGPLYPGTVVEFGGSNEITIAVTNHSSRVAGIISTRPSHLMNATLTGDHAYAVALTGRVPCTVIGMITKGDCLVSSDHPGAAQRLDQEKFVPGCIIGKALQDHDSDSIGTIEVAVGRF